MTKAVLDNSAQWYEGLSSMQDIQEGLLGKRLSEQRCIVESGKPGLSRDRGLLENLRGKKILNPRGASVPRILQEGQAGWCGWRGEKRNKSEAKGLSSVGGLKMIRTLDFLFCVRKKITGGL